VSVKTRTRASSLMALEIGLFVSPLFALFLVGLFVQEATYR